jgi:DNA-binding GntR family transcriptional regulator
LTSQAFFLTFSILLFGVTVYITSWCFQVNDPKGSRLKPSLYANILDRIVTGQFPPGYRLAEEQLALTFHVSRTPIREVLFSLHKDGLVERSHNRGAKVVSFGADDVEQIYEIRAALECLAVRKAVQRLGLDGLREIERRLLIAGRRASKNWKQDLADIDLHLHKWIISHSGNRRLTAYLENISLLIHSFRLIDHRNADHALLSGKEHLAIVQALLRRDGPLAERLLAAHIHVSMRRILELFSSSQNTAGVLTGPSKSRRGSKGLEDPNRALELPVPDS